MIGMAVFRYVYIAELFLALTASSAYTAIPDNFSVYAVHRFGAAGDGHGKDTAAVQQTIDACAAGGGGTVYFASGTYLCGSLHLRSNVTLHLDNGATILASTDDAEFDPYEKLGFENDYVSGLRLDDIRFKVNHADTRHVVLVQDVTDLAINAFRAPAVQGAAAQLFFHQVRDALIQGCQLPKTVEHFLEISGRDSGEISLSENVLNGEYNPIVLHPEVAQGTVRSDFNP